MKCLLCNTPLELFLFKNGYRIYRCPACGLGETDLKTNYDRFVKEFYSEGYYGGDPSRSAYVNYEKDKPYIVRNMKKFLSYVSIYKKRGKLLDIGCAFGYFVELARSKGYDAYGIDPSAYAAKRARRLVGKNRIQEVTIKSAAYQKESFDVITLFDVFEHLSNPLSDMKKLNALLKKDGVIMIATGDTDSIAARIMKRTWTFYIPPQHTFFFNRANATYLLERAGFTPIHWHRAGKWLSLGYILHLARTIGESVVAEYLYRAIQHTVCMKIPLYIPMYDNMVIIARKTDNGNSLTNS